MSLLLVRLPKAKFTPILISNEQIEESTGPAYWQMETGLSPEEVDSWIVLGNPFAPELERWLTEWNVAFPEAQSIGGLSSGMSGPGENGLLLDGKLVDAAVLALAVKGAKLRTIVSQGCKPVGEPFTITQAEENLVYALGSRPAYQVLSETFNALADDEKERARGNLFAGLAASEYVADLKRGDFLVRNLLGADPQTGAVAIGARARTGQTLQYQLRDKITAHHDLVELAKMNGLQGCAPFASLLFFLQRPRPSLFWRAESRRLDPRGNFRQRPDGRFLLQWRDRAGRPGQLSARLYGLGRALLRLIP
jgi:small ligand-binding sensory domain FIST